MSFNYGNSSFDDEMEAMNAFTYSVRSDGNMFDTGSDDFSGFSNFGFPSLPSMLTTTPPAPAQVRTAPAQATTVDPQHLMVTPPAPVAAPAITPFAPQTAAVTTAPISTQHLQVPTTTGAPSKKGNKAKEPKTKEPKTKEPKVKKPAVKKQKRTTVTGIDGVANHNSLSTVMNSGQAYGLGIIQPQQLVGAQPMPQGYQASTNPAHANLFNGQQVQRFNPPRVQHFNPPQAQYLYPPQAYAGFGTPPVMQMQNASLLTPPPKVQRLSGPIPRQQLSAFAPPADSTPRPQENTVQEPEDIYTIAAKAKMSSLLSGPAQQDADFEGLPGLPDLAAHVELARQLFNNGTLKQLAEFLGSSPEMQTKIIADAAASAYADQMFENQSAEKIHFFLNSSLEMKLQTMNNTAGFEPPMASIKRKRADSVIDGAPLFSPATDTFIHGMQDTDSVFGQQIEDEIARLDWEAANAKREKDMQMTSAANQQKTEMLKLQGDSIRAQHAAAVAEKITPVTPSFSFGENDSELPDFEDDVEPVDETQEETNTVAHSRGATPKLSIIVPPTTNTGVIEEVNAVPISSITTNAFEEDSGDGLSLLYGDDDLLPLFGNDDLSSLFGDDDNEEPAAPTVSAPTVSASNAIPRSSFPPMPIPPVYAGEDAMTEDDKRFAEKLNNRGPSNFTGDNANQNEFDMSGFDMGGLSNLPLSHDEFNIFGGSTTTFTRSGRTNDFDDPDKYNDVVDVMQGYPEMGNENASQEMDDETDQNKTDTAPTYGSPPTQQNNYMSAPSFPPAQAQVPYSASQQQHTPPQQQQYVPPPQFHYFANAPQSYIPPAAPNNTPPAPQATQVAEDNGDTEEDLDAALDEFLNQAVDTVAPPPPAPQRVHYPTIVQPALTAADGEQPLCPIFLASNGAHCPYGSACPDRHYYISGPGLSLTQAINTQMNYMAVNSIPDQTVVQEGLMVTRFKRGARFDCKNCSQKKPVTLKNDGVRCTPCFKRWCKGED